MAKNGQIFVWYSASGRKKGPHEKVAFTGESNIEHVDGHHNGHFQNGETDCGCELQDGLVCLTLEEMDGLCGTT